MQVIESYSYFSLSVAMTLYLTDEFGISDLAVRFFLFGLVFAYDMCSGASHAP